MNKSKTYLLKKSIISSAIAAALSVSVVPNAQADIYSFTFSNGGCTAGIAGSCSPNNDWLDRETDSTGPLGDVDTDVNESSDAFFTLLNKDGAVTQNSSVPYNTHYYWYGLRTPVSGAITIDNDNGIGVATINSFDFFGSGPAVAKDITMSYVGDGSGNTPTPAGDLWIGQMLFDWNLNVGIPLSTVWDMSGLMTSLPNLDVNNMAAVANAISGGPGVGVLGASSGIVVAADTKGDTSMNPGELLIATTSLNTTPLCTPVDVIDPFSTPSDSPPGCMTLNPSGSVPVLLDSATNTNTGTTGISGSPMIDGPFSKFSPSFDFKRLTLSGYNDTTPPVMAVTPSAPITLVIGDTFSKDAPAGISLACTDNADITSDLTITSISTVDTSAAGQYKVTYTCTDKAGLRTAISDPANPGSVTVPQNNTHSVDLIVNVNAPGQPTVNITDATTLTHEACTTYSDAGATAVNDTGNLISPVIVTDNDSIIGQQPNELVATIDYDITNLTVAAQTQTRTVNVVDSLPPVLTVTGVPFSMESTFCDAFAASLPTASVVDANSCNPPSPAIANTSNSVTCIVPDGQDTITSTLLYTAADTSAAVNSGSTSIDVLVSRSEPVVSQIGSDVTLDVDVAYVEQGFNVHDVQDGDLSAVTASGTTAGTGAEADNLLHEIIITDDNAANAVISNIDTSINGGRYTVTYKVTDSDGNDAVSVSRRVSVGVFAAGSNFTMLEKTGKVIGGTNDVVFDWDETTYSSEAAAKVSNATLTSAKPEKFQGFVWTAHNVRVFGPGTYSFDTGCSPSEIEATGCPAGSAASTGATISMTVPSGSIGTHILFDWNTSVNIDVVNVWEPDAVWNDADGSATFTNNLHAGASGNAPDPAGTWKLVSRDVNGDGINGSPMVDGPFQGFYANFNIGPSGSVESPVITTVTIDTKLGKDGLGSMGLGVLGGLASLLGLALFRRR